MTTTRSWAELIDRIEIKFPVKIELRAMFNQRDPGDVELRGMFEVPDIITGEPTRVWIVDFPPPIDDMEPLEAARYLRNFALRLLAHELDETFIVDGKKLHDPHTQDTYIPRYL